MQIHDLEYLLEDHPFVQGMNFSHLRILLGCCINREYETGEYVMRRDEEANEFFLIREGNVSIEVPVPGRSAILVESRSGGDVIGWSSLSQPHRWHFDSIAQTPVAALTVDIRTLREKFHQDREFGFEILNLFIPLIMHDVRVLEKHLAEHYPGIESVGENTKEAAHR